MNTKDFRELRIVFMGTPEFAVSSLKALVDAGCNVVAVITAPDKPAGRGMLLQQSPVKKFAIDYSIKILQPENLKNPEFVEELKSLNADLQVVVAFRMLPEIVWSMPAMGTINLHASLLPQYRGAAPINWAIINGEKETGVTTFKLKHEIDTGDILLQEAISIDENETAGELHDRMMVIGAQLLVKTIRGLSEGVVVEVPQQSNEGIVQADGSVQAVKQAPKIHADLCRINWSNPVEVVFNLVRGLCPVPAAFIVINEKMMKIFKCKKEICLPAVSEGEYETDGKSFLKFACSNGYLHLLEVQMEGKKRMGIEEFLRGFRS